MNNLLAGALQSNKKFALAMAATNSGSSVTIKMGTFANLFYEYREVLRGYDQYLDDSEMRQYQNVVNLRDPKVEVKTVREIADGYTQIVENVFTLLRHKGLVHIDAAYRFNFITPYLYQTREEAELNEWRANFVCTPCSSDFIISMTKQLLSS